MLFKTRTLTFEHSLPFLAEEVREYIQDPAKLIRCNPDVVEAREEEKKDGTWHVTAKLSLLFLSFHTHYTATFSQTPEGIVGRSNAGMGTTTSSTFSVRAPPSGAEDESVLREVFEVRALFFFLSFILGTVQDVHGQTAKGVEKGLREQKEAATRR